MSDISDLPTPVAERLVRLPRGLREHIERSRDVARSLAARHETDACLADIGIAAHDLARAVPPRQLLAEAERLGLDPSPVEKREPILLHGAVAEAWLMAESKEWNSEVLESVRWHTTGRAGMGQIAKVVFLADKLDPRKVERYPFLARVADLAKCDLDAAILEYLNRTLAYLIERNLLVHPASIGLRNELIIRMNRRS